MARIQKRGKTYQYTISRTVNGKSKPIRKGGFRTKKEARIAANELEAQLNKGILPHLKPIPYNEYFNKWFHLYKKHVTQTTFKHYEYTLNAIENHFYDKAIQDITKHDYQEFINTFGSNKAKETVEKVNTHIRACVKDAMDEQIIFQDFTRKAVLAWTVPAKKGTDKHLETILKHSFS